MFTTGRIKNMFRDGEFEVFDWVVEDIIDDIFNIIGNDDKVNLGIFELFMENLNSFMIISWLVDIFFRKEVNISFPPKFKVEDFF